MCLIVLIKGIVAAAMAATNHTHCVYNLMGLEMNICVFVILRKSYFEPYSNLFRDNLLTIFFR